VFIVASLGTDRASEVLFECEGGCGHPQAGESSWQKIAGVPHGSAEVAGAILSRYRKGTSSTVENGQLVLTTALTRGGMGGGFGADDNDAQGNKLVIGEKADASGVRAADGLGGRLDNRTELEAQKKEVKTWRKSRRPQSASAPETWVEDGVANTLNVFDTGDIRSTHIVESIAMSDDEQMLPEKLDGNRYKCCGNGVVANVSEWIARRIIAVDEAYQ
jgi:hypothetical protein